MVHMRTLHILNYISLFLFFAHHATAIDQDTSITHGMQQFKQVSIKDPFELFWQQPLYNKLSIKSFLENVYNNNAYAQRFLAFNFSHMHTLLTYAQENEKPKAYVVSVLKLFTQKLKSATYINAYAFSELLILLPELLKPLALSDLSHKEVIKRAVKDRLYTFFLQEFNELKESPEDTLNKLSNNLYDIAHTQSSYSSDDIALTELQQSIGKFLEVTLGKLIWCATDQQEVWKSVKDISYNLELLLVNNSIANVETLDELYWTLIHRFCYFLNVAGNQLKQECYHTIQEDLTHKRFTLWASPEREAYITSKEDHFKQALLDSEVRSRAWQAGMISDYIPVNL